MRTYGYSVERGAFLWAFIFSPPSLLWLLLRLPLHQTDFTFRRRFFCRLIPRINDSSSERGRSSAGAPFVRSIYPSFVSALLRHPCFPPSFGFSLLKGAAPAPSPSSFPHLLSIRAFSPSSSANTQGRMADLISLLLLCRKWKDKGGE